MRVNNKDYKTTKISLEFIMNVHIMYTYIHLLYGNK